MYALDYSDRSYHNITLQWTVLLLNEKTIQSLDTRWIVIAHWPSTCLMSLGLTHKNNACLILLSSINLLRVG
jgi:hypothetical protein